MRVDPASLKAIEAALADGRATETTARRSLLAGPSAPPLDLLKTEAEFQEWVIQTAQGLGWAVAHFRKARTKAGWVTPVAADGAGFPDLLLCRERVVFAELKVPPNKPSRAQREWARRLAAAGQEYYVWVPADCELILAVLERGGPG